ncbi:MAG: CrcB family protein [Nocardioidaceae bacterium]|nr:MAG: CrcB family protein [Nocardioidaceae bacterium]
MTALLVALGAAVGAGLRFAVATRLDRQLPWGTLLVNVFGSFVLGYLIGSAAGHDEVSLLGVGFCGGLTTYSAFSVQTYSGGWRLGSIYVALTLVLAIPACALGYALGRL